MLQKTMTYVDYDGNKRTETFCFNLSNAELIQMEFSKDGGLVKMLQRISDTQDRPKMMEIFREIILKSYGEKTADGKRFVKSPELSEAFSQTEAFSDLFMELTFNDGVASEFINGVIPQGLEEKLAKKTDN